MAVGANSNNEPNNEANNEANSPNNEPSNNRRGPLRASRLALRRPCQSPRVPTPTAITPTAPSPREYGGVTTYFHEDSENVRAPEWRKEHAGLYLQNSKSWWKETNTPEEAPYWA
jgi:hypothetical protein